MATTIALVPFCAATLSVAASAPGEAQLNELLPRLAKVSDLYRDSALRFSCEETITDTGLGDHTYLFDYMYVYSKPKGFQDYRTSRGGGYGPGHAGPVDLTIYGVPRYLRQAFSWVFIFSEGRQPLHTYTIL